MCLEEPMSSPALTPCAHLMCRECLRDCLQREPCCPVRQGGQKKGKEGGVGVGDVAGRRAEGYVCIAENKRDTFWW